MNEHIWQSKAGIERDEIPDDRRCARVDLRIAGTPCPTIPPCHGAIWATDRITPLVKLGSRYWCLVIWGVRDQYRCLALLRKRDLRFIRP